ncbi:MAG: STAS domain-containing protein [Opitutales bacterium]|nr:STAS domain-containing protein [Opitutales bacterium]
MSTFFQEMIVEGPPRFIIDFENCTGMDSTFLGIIAGAALETRKGSGGYLALMRLGERNLELVRNLGLHRLAKVDTGKLEQQLEDTDAPQPREGDHAVTRTGLIEAHENLAGINEENLEKFQDIVEYLKSRTREGADQ